MTLMDMHSYLETQIHGTLMQTLPADVKSHTEFEELKTIQCH